MSLVEQGREEARRQMGTTRADLETRLLALQVAAREAVGGMADVAAGLMMGMRPQDAASALKLRLDALDAASSTIERLQEESLAGLKLVGKVTALESSLVQSREREDRLQQLLMEERSDTERLRALLREVEWRGKTVFMSGDWQSDCPVCGQREAEGHKPDCRLALALSEEGRE